MYRVHAEALYWRSTGPGRLALAAERQAIVISLRDLEFLSSLARRRHFAKAAEDCGVSQPAFSMRIRNLEEKVGMPLVNRGNRFQGFTAEGTALVRHARKILDDLKIMEQEFRSARGEITGKLSVGVIPTAIVFASKAVKNLQARHPGIRVRLETASSLAIQQGLEDGEFDAGFTYREGVAGDLFRTDPLYGETYMLLAPASLAPSKSGTATWSEAAELPLCLLVRGMQNRSILDKVFHDLALAPKVVTEASGFIASMVLASEGMSATIVPTPLVESFGQLSGTVALKLVEPDLEKQVCLISRSRETDLPTVDALRAVCAEV